MSTEKKQGEAGEFKMARRPAEKFVRERFARYRCQRHRNIKLRGRGVVLCSFRFRVQPDHTRFIKRPGNFLQSRQCIGRQRKLDRDKPPCIAERNEGRLRVTRSFSPIFASVE